jgi:hypothetical protein
VREGPGGRSHGSAVRLTNKTGGSGLSAFSGGADLPHHREAARYRPSLAMAAEQFSYKRISRDTSYWALPGKISIPWS